MSDLPEDPRISTGDRDIVHSAVTGEGLVPITSAEQFMAIARMAEETKTVFDGKVENLSAEQCAYVRRLRVDEGYSWRAVAEACYLEWQGDWLPPSNQLMGMALCEKAAKHFGEEYMDSVWNG